MGYVGILGQADGIGHRHRAEFAAGEKLQELDNAGEKRTHQVKHTRQKSARRSADGRDETAHK